MFEEIKGLQQKELEILKELKRVCGKNNITYFLAYGSLIGAIRHRGFIPWDDDIDVCMMYKDYVRFQEVCKKDLGSRFFLQSSQSEPDAELTYCKLRMNDTTFIIDKTEGKNIHQGINIDIYPFYHVADNKIARNIQYLCAAVHMLFERGEAPENHGWLMRIGSKVFLFLFRGKLRNRIKQICNRGMTKYEKGDKHTGGIAGLYGNMDICRNVFPKECFEGTVQVPFEDDIFTAPVGYDRFLQIEYGDYMQMPPKEEQGCKLEHILKIDTENSYKKYI